VLKSFFLAIALCSAVAMAATSPLTVTPAALQFSYQIGNATLPAAQTVQVQSSPAGVNFSVAVSGAPFNAAWLLVSASTGKAPASLKVQVNPTGLPAGTYAGTLTFSATVNAQSITQTTNVTLMVSSAPATVTATPAALNFSYTTGSPIPDPTLTSAFVLSSSGSALSATVSVKGAAWLKVAPTGNISLVGLLNTISVTVDPTGLAPKVYSGTISVSAPAAVNKTLSISVSLTVNAATPTVAGTWPSGAIQGSGPTIVTLDGTSYYSNSAVAATGFTPATTVTVTDGASTATETLFIPAYQSTATALALAVASPLPSGKVGTAYSQPLAATGGTGPYTYASIGAAMPAGLSISGTSITGTPTAAGSYFLTIQVTDSSATPIQAYGLLKITIDPAGAAALRITVAAAPLPLGTVGTAYGPVTLTAAGGAGPLTWTATNLPPGMTLSSAGVLAGTPSTDGALGVITGSMVSDKAILATVPSADLANPGILRMAVTTPAPGGGTSNEAQFQVYGAGPQILAVTNSASFAQGTIAPGELITIFGLGIGPQTLTIFDPSTPPIPTSLPATGSATTVKINGTDAPILYTSATQVGVIVPYTVNGASAQVVVSYGTLTSQAFTVSLALTDPGLFSIASSGQGQGAILNYNSTTGDYTVNSGSNPALKGSTIVIYMTGAGAMSSAVYNQLIPANPAVTPSQAPLVTIGGQAASVTGAQAPVGSVPGLLQINATVPSNIQAGAAQPVVVTIGGVSSQTGLTMAVK
jgi:uncharacterized protein (TIGR03437 family)